MANTIRRIKVDHSSDQSGDQRQGKIMKSMPTPEMVEERARELAAIAGRQANRPTHSDRQQARRELIGPIHPTSRRQDDPQDLTEPWEPAASSGRRAQKNLPQDDQVTKELVEEGVDEAEHDQMTQARRNRK